MYFISTHSKGLLVQNVNVYIVTIYYMVAKSSILNSKNYI